MFALTNLLPGLRDLRGPLAVGFIWLFLGWLAVILDVIDFGDDIKSFALNPPFGDSVVANSALVATLSISAYLIGIVSIRAITPIAQPIVAICIFLPAVLVALVALPSEKMDALVT